jgi:alkylation response protein AidB-like acyl-CoA dehydrogenase
VLNQQLLTQEHKNNYRNFCEFVQEHVAPFAEEWDKNRGVPREVIEKCSKAGYVGGIIPAEFGGGGWDAVTFGLLNEAIGAASSSLCALFTVQTMVAMPLVKWGSKEQQKEFLEPMAKGDIIASFATTEPKVGSDLQSIETTLTPQGNIFLLNGTKRWITYSGIADIFLVFARTKDEDKPVACIVRSNAPGIKITRLEEMLGFRGVYLSQIEFNECEIQPEDLLGRPGFALTYVAPYGLHYGRLSTAWSSAGLLRACIETCTSFVAQRRAFDHNLIDHGQIRELIADMGVDLEAARLLCLHAALAEDARQPKAMEKALMAKYYSSRAAAKAAATTIQMMGAAGCYEENRAARYYRNAKIMEIIEGTHQVLQNVLGKSFFKHFSKQSPITIKPQ